MDWRHLIYSESMQFVHVYPIIIIPFVLHYSRPNQRYVDEESEASDNEMPATPRKRPRSATLAAPVPPTPPPQLSSPYRSPERTVREHISTPRMSRG